MVVATRRFSSSRLTERLSNGTYVVGGRYEEEKSSRQTLCRLSFFVEALSLYLRRARPRIRSQGARSPTFRGTKAGLTQGEEEMSTDSSVINDVMWTEKYRPQSLDDMALEPENRAVLAQYIKEGVIPHLLLIGPSGSGKTTISRILTRTLDCVTLPLNASSERGIDTVRGKIRDFVGAVTRARWNVVFLDEADAMTSDAQTSMRNLIESFSERARFILTANYGHRIIGPIQSRCQVLAFGRPPLKERTRILMKVLAAEGITTTPQNALAYAEKYPDLRSMLWAAQRGFLGSGGKELPPAQDSGIISGEEMFKRLTSKNYTGFKQLTTSNDFDIQQGFRELFHAIPDEYPRAGFLRHVIGRGVHESGFTPDPTILFLGVISEAMEGL